MDRHTFVEREHVDGCVDCGQSANAPIHNEPTPSLVAMDALGFAEFARQLGAALRDMALVVPAFRARAGDDPEQTRSIVRNPAGPVVRVPNLRTRPAADTKRDMIDGACEANNLHHDHPKRWLLLDRMGDA